MKTILAVALLFLVSSLSHGQEWKPSDKLLDAIRQVESSGGKFVYGDRGRSLGDFQMGRAAWTDVSQWRKARNLTLYNYRTDVFRSDIAREYASNYLSILRTGLLKKLQREPSASELYAAYNIGLTRFWEQSRYDIRRINSMTARKCREIETMIANTPTQLANAAPSPK
ncbi:MAG: hypothetical protein H0X66_01285 [Verrucomicrobia bacterium]|nr:hypothetical protein [Verrucomicrobiota bacterium]